MCALECRILTSFSRSLCNGIPPPVHRRKLPRGRTPSRAMVWTVGLIFALCLGVTVAMQCSFFAIAFLCAFDKVTDLAGSTNFIVLGVLTLFLHEQGFALEDITTRQLVLTSLVCITRAELAAYLLYRVLKRGRDSRFDEIRSRCLSFFGFWVYQMLWVYLVSAPLIYVNASAEDPPLGPCDYIGWAMIVVGFVLEVAADVQKNAFRSDPANAKSVCTVGVWRYSRHPKCARRPCLASHRRRPSRVMARRSAAPSAPPRPRAQLCGGDPHLVGRLPRGRAGLLELARQLRRLRDRRLAPLHDVGAALPVVRRTTAARTLRPSERQSVARLGSARPYCALPPPTCAGAVHRGIPQAEGQFAKRWCARRARSRRDLPESACGICRSPRDLLPGTTAAPRSCSTSSTSPRRRRSGPSRPRCTRACRSGSSGCSASSAPAVVAQGAAPPLPP